MASAHAAAHSDARSIRGRRSRGALGLLVALVTLAFPSAATAGKSDSPPVLLGAPTPASATALPAVRLTGTVTGFNTFSLPANDDGSTGSISLPFAVNYFGKTYKSLFINNNGNLTFASPLSQYTPQPLGSISFPIIAPFWGDVDTRVGNVVTYGKGTIEGHSAFGVTWPGVGCYDQNDNTTNAFQVILVNRSDTGTSNFDIQFRYGPINWESGQASGGNGGCLEGAPARAGYASGTGLAYELPGSGTTNALLSSDPTTGLSNQGYGSSEPGVDVFPVRGGQPTPTASAEYASLGDSYSAGEGDGSYTYGTGVAKNNCDRSPYAYGPLLAQSFPAGALAFVACSGAITDDFLTPNHEANISVVTKKLEAPQFSVLGARTKTITWTIGGNDIGFSELGEKCFFVRWSIFKVYGSSGCSKRSALVAAVHERINALAGVGTATTPKKVPIQSVLSLLLEAHQRAPSAKIYVAGYPRLFGTFSGECGVGQLEVTNLPRGLTEIVAVKVASGDAVWLNTVADELDSTIASAAATAETLTGASVTYVDPDPEYEQDRLCDTGVSWIHEIEGKYNYETKRLALFPGSFHPTTVGQQDGYDTAFLAGGFGQ